MMYRKSLYDPHNESLDTFILKFNNAQIYPNLIAIRCPQENYKHDAIFIDTNNKKSIGFDWSKSPQVLFIDDKWKYSQYTLIASKYEIESSDLYITTDAHEKNVLVLWREDINPKQITYFIDRARPGGEILRPAYKTNSYKIYSLDKIELFKMAIKNALDTNNFKLEEKIK